DQIRHTRRRASACIGWFIYNRIDAPPLQCVCARQSGVPATDDRDSPIRLGRHGTGLCSSWQESDRQAPESPRSPRPEGGWRDWDRLQVSGGEYISLSSVRLAPRSERYRWV